MSLESFRSHYGPGVDSDSNRNEYQKYFLGVKAGGKEDEGLSEQGVEENIWT